MQKQVEANQEMKHRVITLLGRQELEFLDKLGKDSLFSTGHKLSYNQILNALVDLAMETGITGEKVDSIKMLKEKIIQRILDNLGKRIEKENTF